jgi:cation diffusion facilitator CzcD-associated flavoprotein CzcO
MAAKSQAGKDSLTELDVIIVGAGVSGINAAYRLKTAAPAGTAYTILEARNSIGGTWDLFRYPGIRSDSDIFSFGFSWSPWYRREVLAQGADIRQYMIDSAKSAGIDQHIQYRHKVLSANWLSDAKVWELNVLDEPQQETRVYRSRFLFLGTGYYNYEEPRQTVIPGLDDFQGKIIHPQFWPEDYDYTDKEVVIVGSGATAITLVPSMADKVKRITMLQRSPTYVLPVPNHSKLRDWLFALLPRSIVHRINRSIWIFVTYIVSVFCARFPEVARKALRRANTSLLPRDVPHDPHFTPRYKPWEQRLCVSPDGDIFRAIRRRKARIVTDTISTVTKETIRLDSGEELRPDVIVTATGIQLLFAGGINFMIDGQPLDVSKKMVWKAAMIQDMPNLVFALGYLKSGSWTLGADCAAQLLIRLMKNMKSNKTSAVTPQLPSSEKMDTKPLWGLLNSTYLAGYESEFPQTGTGIWCNRDNYIKDIIQAKWGDLKTGLHFE